MAIQLSRARGSRLVRFFIARRRLLLSVLCGLALLAVLPSGMRPATRYLLAWNLTAALYVFLVFWMIAHSTVDTCRRRAAMHDESDWAIIVLVVAAAAASFGAIFTELAVIKSAQLKPLDSLAITGMTVVLSWTFTHVIFTLHYANLYYRPADEGAMGGLRFPGDRPPDYRDFLYYAFVIGCAAQTADVSTESREIGRAHV